MVLVLLSVFRTEKGALRRYIKFSRLLPFLQEHSCSLHSSFLTISEYQVHTDISFCRRRIRRTFQFSSFPSANTQTASYAHWLIIMPCGHGIQYPQPRQKSCASSFLSLSITDCSSSSSSGASLKYESHSSSSCSY